MPELEGEIVQYEPGVFYYGIALGRGMSVLVVYAVHLAGMVLDVAIRVVILLIGISVIQVRQFLVGKGRIATEIAVHHSRVVVLRIEIPCLPFYRIEIGDGKFSPAGLYRYRRYREQQDYDVFYSPHFLFVFAGSVFSRRYRFSIPGQSPPPFFNFL